MKVGKKRVREDEKKEKTDGKKEDSPNFLLKLYKILETPEYQNIIQWSDNGKSFIVKNLHDFTEDILPRYYKHNNFSSFVRQLNMYDFHKRRSSQNEHIFYNNYFCRGQKDLIQTIKRKNRKEGPMTKEVGFPDLNNYNNNNEQALIEYFNNDISKKVTKHSLEKALNYLIGSVKENTEKQKLLEDKVEKLGKQNEDFILQNQKMLQEIISKTEYNKKLDAVVWFILEMIFKKQNIKPCSDIKNAILSKDLASDQANSILSNLNTKEYSQIIPIHEMIPKKITLENSANINNIQNDQYKLFVDKYLERTHGNFNKQNDLTKKNNIPLLGSGNCDELLNSVQVSLSPIRIRSRRGSVDTMNSGYANEDFFKNDTIKHINTNKEKKEENVLPVNDSMNMSMNSKNLFDLEFCSENNPGENNINNISVQSDKKYFDKGFFDEDTCS